PIRWTTIDAGGGLTLTVATDALKAAIPEAERPIRLPVSYAETITICRLLGCLPPTNRISDAIWKAAAARPAPVPLVHTEADARNMATVAFSLAHHDNIETTPYDPEDLLADVGKDWVLDNGIGVKGAVNYGWRSFDQRLIPRAIQPLGYQHDSAHYDYSQLLRPVKREAELNGKPIDLLDYLGAKISAHFLAPYRR
ncbi:MAG: hypothetical protein ABI193_15255, partial [Minicystis sp.]